MAKLRAVLFDLYGTLIDIKTDENRSEVFEALSRFLEYRRVFISGKELKELYFVEINQQLAKSRERHPEVDIARAFDTVLRERARTSDRYLSMITAQLYRSLTRDYLRLFDDTFWTLNEFKKRYRLGIVSDAQRIFCMPELRALRLEGFFDAVVISSDYGFRKPDPRMLHIALAMLDVQPEEAAYIGNSFETDLRCARNANLATAVLIRQSEAQKQAYPSEPVADFIASDLREAFDRIRQKPK